MPFLAIYSGKGYFSRVYKMIVESILKTIYQFNDSE